jgi:lipooligosaccharide transport system ATP-binding protein
LIASQIAPHVVEVTGDGVADWARAGAPALAARVEQVGETAFAYCANLEAATATSAAAAGVASLRVLQRPANLEDVFLKLTGRELRD